MRRPWDPRKIGASKSGPTSHSPRKAPVARRRRRRLDWTTHEPRKRAERRGKNGGPYNGWSSFAFPSNTKYSKQQRNKLFPHLILRKRGLLQRNTDETPLFLGRGLWGPALNVSTRVVGPSWTRNPMETNAVEDRRGAFGAVPRLLTQKGGNRTDHLGVCPIFFWGLLKLPVGEHVLRVESLRLFWRAPYQSHTARMSPRPS